MQDSSCKYPFVKFTKHNPWFWYRISELIDHNNRLSGFRVRLNETKEGDNRMTDHLHEAKKPFIPWFSDEYVGPEKRNSKVKDYLSLTPQDIKN